MENEYEKSVRKRNSKNILNNCPFAKVEVFERLCEFENFNVDDAIKQLDDEFRVFFEEIKGYVIDVNEIGWGIDFINSLEREVKFLGEKITEMVREQINFEKSNDLVMDAIEFQQGKRTSIKVTKENKIERQIVYVISTVCKSFILALNDFKENFRYSLFQYVPQSAKISQPLPSIPDKKIEDSEIKVSKKDLDINFIYKNYNQTHELACREFSFYTIFSDFDYFDNDVKKWATIRLPKNNDLDENNVRDKIDGILSKGVVDYFNSIKEHIKTNPLKFKSLELLEFLTQEIFYQRDIDLYSTLQSQVSDFILPDKLARFNECCQNGIYPLLLYNNEYFEILAIINNWFNVLLDGLNILKVDIDPDWKPKYHSLSPGNYNEIYDNQYLPTSEATLMQPKTENLTLEISEPMEQELKDHNAAYKVWMLHKVGVLERLQEGYFNRNPNAKTEDFAKLIHNIIGNNVKIVSINRYITAALKNEEIVSFKLRDQINKTLKEHNLE